MAPSLLRSVAKTACPGRCIRGDRLDDMVLGHLSEQLFATDQLAELLAPGPHGPCERGRARQREKLRQTRDPAGPADAPVSRLLSLVESGVMEPDAPELRERLVALRSHKLKLVRDIPRLPKILQIDELELSSEKLKTLSMEMRKRLVERPPELRQACMRLLLENVAVDHDSIRLEGSPVILEKRARRGLSKASPEVRSSSRERRASVGKGENWNHKIRRQRP